MAAVDVLVDVSEAAGLGEQATVAVTVTLPAADAVGARPVVCFAKPGGVWLVEHVPPAYIL